MVKLVHSGRSMSEAKALIKAVSVGLTPEYAKQRDIIDLLALEGSLYKITSTRAAHQNLWKLKMTARSNLESSKEEVGLGMATDFQGRDVSGKAVVLHSIATSSTVFNSVRRIGALERAEALGAAANFIVLELPGNLQTAFYNVGTSVPTFSIGSEDGRL